MTFRSLEFVIRVSKLVKARFAKPRQHGFVKIKKILGIENYPLARICNSCV